MLNAKRSTARTILAATMLAAAWSSTAAFADEAQTGSAILDFFQMQAKKPMKVMHMMDKDNKGYVTKQEFMKFHEDLFDRMDKDHNGQLSTQEWLGREVRKSDG